MIVSGGSLIDAPNVHSTWRHDQCHWPHCPPWVPISEEENQNILGFPAAPYGYTEPKTLWVSQGGLGFWVLDLRTLEISDSERIWRALRQHKILSVPLNKWSKWAHESRQYLRCYSESRDEWVIIHSFFYSFHKYLLSTLCVRHKDKIEDSCPHGTHKQVTNMKRQGGAWY